MTSVGRPADRNVDGIVTHMRDYLDSREQQVVRMNPVLGNVIKDVAWIHLEILRNVLHKSKAFGGEKYRVADVLAGGDDAKRKALFSNSGDQNSIMDEIIERTDESGKKVTDHSIHDMRSFFRSIDPALENLVQLIQHWIKWDLPDAADQHGFDEQVRRLTALRGVQMTDDLRARYRQALGKTADETVSDLEIFQMEMRRLDQIAGRFCGRRSEDEPYQLIICRDKPAGENSDGDPYNYKLRQCETIARRLEDERAAIDARTGGNDVGQG